MMQLPAGVYRGTLDRELAGRLLRRAAGYVAVEERDGLVGLDVPQAVVRLVGGTQAGPRWQEIQDLEGMSAERGQLNGYRTWELARLVESPQPFREMLTLFWLDLFAVSALRVEPLHLYHDFRSGLREKAFEPLDKIFTFALTHPALLLNLRAPSNYRSQPQAQIGRFLVQYVVGHDPHEKATLVADIARAYTGMFVTSGRLRVLDYEHDPGQKTVGDQTGDLRAEDVARALARDPATIANVVRRLFGWFVTTEVPVPQQLLIAAQKAALDGQPVSAVLTLLLGWEECLKDPRYRRVKSPLEVYLAVARPFGYRATTHAAEALAELGWDVVHPPTLAGWPRGQAWLTGSQVARHWALVRTMLTGGENWGATSQLTEALSRPDWSATLVETLLGGEIPPEVRNDWQKLVQQARDETAKKEAVAFLAGLPEFQLS